MTPSALHRSWFTWPSWVYYAWYLDHEQEQLLADILAGRYVL